MLVTNLNHNSQNVHTLGYNVSYKTKDNVLLRRNYLKLLGLGWLNFLSLTKCLHQAIVYYWLLIGLLQCTWLEIVPGGTFETARRMGQQFVEGMRTLRAWWPEVQSQVVDKYILKFQVLLSLYSTLGDSQEDIHKHSLLYIQTELSVLVAYFWTAPASWNYSNRHDRQEHKTVTQCKLFVLNINNLTYIE